jgi:pimeloyl-ACP methyl ester carboxylesterase
MKIILVHGGWQGGWAWDAVAEHLRAAGHEVFAPTLRGLEDGDVDRAGITITDMTDDLVLQIDQRSFDRFVLVAHSGGGPVIQLVTDRMPDRVDRAVFVDAWVLHNGECINDVLPTELVDGVRALAEQTPDSTIDIPPGMWSSAFMQDASDETMAATVSRLVPTPFGWFTEPIGLTRFFTAEVPTSYVFLRDDQAVPQTVYKAAAARLADPRIVECTGSHEAMLTHPAELAQALREAIA